MSQLFKHNVPKKLLTEIIHTYFYYNDVQKNYILNKSVYKKLILLKVLPSFIHSIKSFYYSSKQYYVNRIPITYSNFTTIIRQLCKHLNIHIISKIIYSNSTYEIEYYITINKPYTISCNVSACSSACSSVCSSSNSSPRNS